MLFCYVTAMNSTRDLFEKIITNKLSSGIVIIFIHTTLICDKLATCSYRYQIWLIIRASNRKYYNLAEAEKMNACLLLCQLFVKHIRNFA